MKLAGVVCRWEWSEPDECWKLNGSYAIDRDGRPVLKDDISRDDWMIDSDGSGIKGRAISSWTFWGGVILSEVNPPSGLPKWMSWDLDSEFTFKSLAGGATMRFITVSEAERLLGF